MSRNLPLNHNLDQLGFPIARECCFKCFRPSSHCLCDQIETFKAHTNFLILQHPHEKRKYYSTAKLVLKSISNSEMLRGIEFDPAFLQQKLSAGNFYLLYPGADSIDCQSLTLSSQDTIVVLDGTWSEAGKILHRNPILHSLPKVSFTNEFKSQYRIRKQPKAKYLSTIESIAYLLKLSVSQDSTSSRKEYLKKYDQLFEVFSAMVEKQLAYFPD